MDIFGITWIDLVILLTWALTTALAKSWGPEFFLSYTAVWAFIAVFSGFITEPMADAMRGGNPVVKYLLLYGVLVIPIVIVMRFGPKLLKVIFINNLGRRIDFALEATYYRPSGSILGSTTLNASVEAPWPESRHWHGLGWNEPGKWPVGQYRVDVSEGENIVATSNFTIANAPDSATIGNANSGDAHKSEVMPNPKGSVTSINGQVDELRFFEKGNGSIPQAERVYLTTFPKESTRRVAWEVHLKYPPPYTRVYHLIGWGVGALGSFLVLSLILSVLKSADTGAIAQKIEESRFAVFMASLSDVITSGFVAITS